MSLNNLGTMLSELGRRKEALAAAEEAVRIRRGLAAQRPDAFIPDLAMSLGAKGAILDANGERSQARDCFREGIVCLKSLFLRLPVAHRRLMLGLVGGYVRACQAAGSEPDGALLYDLLEPLGFGSGEPSE